MQPPSKSRYENLSLQKTQAVTLTIKKCDSFLEKKQKREDENILLIMDNKKFKEKLHSQIRTYSTYKNQIKFRPVNYPSFSKSEEIYKMSYKNGLYPEESPRGGLNILLATRFNTVLFKDRIKGNMGYKTRPYMVKNENSKVKKEGLFEKFYDKIKKDYEHSHDCKVSSDDLSNHKIKLEEREINKIKVENQMKTLKDWVKNNFYSKQNSK
jgi:hypothetical protein